MSGNESPDARLKRLTMRSWRRGMKEMDVILGNFADDCLSNMDDRQLALYDDLLSENDRDLYAWITGSDTVPAQFSAQIAEIALHAHTRLAGRTPGIRD